MMSTKYEFTLRETGFKIELFFIRGDDEFAQERFKRRVPKQIFGRNAWLPTPKGVIVQKLR